jgi:cysteine synthase A
MLEQLGAEVVLVPQVDGAPGQVTGLDIGVATVWAREIALALNGFYVDQFNAVEGCGT